MRQSDRYATKNRHWGSLQLAYSRCRSTNKWFTLICKILAVITLLIVLFVLTGCFVGASSYAVYNNTSVDIVKKTLEWTLLLVIIECLVIGVMVLLVMVLTRETDQYEYVEEIEIDEFPSVPNSKIDCIDEASL